MRDDAHPSARRPSRRRWLLIAGGMACAVLLGVRLVAPPLARLSIVREVEKQGGYVRTSRVGPEWLRGMIGDERMRGFDTITELSPGNKSRIDDDWYRRLVVCPELVRLDLYQASLGDAGLAHLKLLPALRSISAGETRVTDAGLAHLAAMKDLEFLGLRGDDVGDAGLAHLAELVHLKGLLLAETRVTDAGLTHLSRMDRLTMLSLASTPVTEQGLQQVARLPALTLLYVSDDQLTADGMDDLKRIHPGLTVTVMMGRTAK